MIKGWRECKLGDVAEINPSESLKKGILAKKIPMDALWPFTKKISQYTIEPYNGGVKFRNGDILVARITPSLENGKTSFVDILDEDEVGFGSTEFIVLREKTTQSDKHFLYYFAISSEFREVAINSMNGSSGRQRVQNEVIFKHKFSLPPLQEQKAIAEILSSLDDKIELLYRQNQTLESIAQTLFRQWFIQDAKPEWEEKPLSKIADFLNGLACQKFPPKNNCDQLPVLKIKDLKDGISENSDYATTDIESKYIVNTGDVIFAWSASLMVKIWDGGQCILNQHLFKVTSKGFPKWFHYHWCKYHLDNFIAISSAHATTMGHIKRGDLDEAICIVPSSRELSKMNEKIMPLFEKLEKNFKQIQTLENLRDTLLPKLISGELRIAI